MVDFFIIGAAAGGLIVKGFDFVKEILKAEPELSLAEREALKKKQKADKEAQEWANRPVMTDESFAVLKDKIESFGKLKDVNFAWVNSLLQSVMECGMRFSIAQIQELKPFVAHWCVYDGKTDKKRAELYYVDLVKESLTAKVEAKEAILN